MEDEALDYVAELEAEVERLREEAGKKQASLDAGREAFVALSLRAAQAEAEVERLKEAANRAAGIIVTMPTHGDPGIIDALQRAVAALRGEEK